MEQTFYDFSAKDSAGNVRSMDDFSGKVIVVVNTATHCGFSPQLKELQTLYRKYAPQGLVILGFPCNQFSEQEPVSDEDMIGYCEMNFGVSFPLFAKIDVNGEQADPLFVWLKKQARGVLGSAIKWNFTKFLIDRKGKVIARLAPATHPTRFEQDIKNLL